MQKHLTFHILERDLLRKNDEKKANGTWTVGAFLSTIQTYRNMVLSGKHSVAASDIFCSYLCRGLKKPDSTPLKAFNAQFEALMKLPQLLC